MICRYGAAFQKWALKKIKACYADAGVEVCSFSMLFVGVLHLAQALMACTDWRRVCYTE